jgi:hypothetical protein
MAEEMEQRFSDRLGIRRPAGGLIYQDAPEPILHAFLNQLRALDNLIPDWHWKSVYRLLEGAIDKWTPDTHYTVSINTIAELVGKCEWFEFYDLVEEVVQILEPHSDLQALFVNDFNHALLRNHVGYELREGRIEKVGARQPEAVIAEVRAILRDPELVGPDQQFQKAIGFFNRRPEPDVENCVKDAVGAVEALARILLNDASILLGKAMKKIGEQKGVHPTLQKLVENLYAYRGDAEGAAHGKTGAKASVTEADAEFVLHTSAACIVYLARLYGKGVE